MAAKPVIVVGDISSKGHVAGSIAGLTSKVFVDKKAVVVVGDPYATITHPADTPHASVAGVDPLSLTLVYAGGKLLTGVGDPLACGDLAAINPARIPTVFFG